MERHIVNLTFDLEEFDIPEEFGQSVSHQDQMEITKQGMVKLISILNRQNIVVTFFTTGNYAKNNPELIRQLSQKHEIASHALFHSPTHVFEENDILASKHILESLTGKRITGFRMPRLRPFDISKLAEWGFDYDSSINPTYIPGRYNLLHKSPVPYREGGLWELPCSTTPLLRFPLFWLSFKNLPQSIYSLMCLRTLRKRNSLMLYFHPWEFANLEGFKLPGYIKRRSGTELVERLESLIEYLLKNNAEFTTCQTHCNHLNKVNRNNPNS